MGDLVIDLSSVTFAVVFFFSCFCVILFIASLGVFKRSIFWSGFFSIGESERGEVMRIQITASIIRRNRISFGCWDEIRLPTTRTRFNLLFRRLLVLSVSNTSA